MELAQEYVALFGDAAITAPDGGADAAEAAKRQQQLVFHLNRSGKYLDMKARLKESVRAVAQETFRRGLGALGDELDVYNALYVHTVDAMHAVLNGLRADEAAADAPPDAAAAAAAEAELERLEQLAAECEVTGDGARAERLHQERCVALTDSQCVTTESRHLDRLGLTGSQCASTSASAYAAFWRATRAPCGGRTASSSRAPSAHRTNV